jgi:hypothetical protein
MYSFYGGSADSGYINNNNSSYVLFDTLSVFFQNHCLAMNCCENKMCIQIIKFNFHLLLNKVIRLYQIDSLVSTKVEKYK